MVTNAKIIHGNVVSWGGIGGTRVFNVILISFSCGVGLIARLHVKKNNDMYEDVLSGGS